MLVKALQGIRNVFFLRVLEGVPQQFRGADHVLAAVDVGDQEWEGVVQPGRQVKVIISSKQEKFNYKVNKISINSINLTSLSDKREGADLCRQTPLCSILLEAKKHPLFFAKQMLLA